MTTLSPAPEASGIGPVVGGVALGGGVAAATFAAAPVLLGPGGDATMRIVLAIAAGSIAALLGVIVFSVLSGRKGARRRADSHPDAPPRAPVSVHELELTDIVSDDDFLAATPVRVARPAAPLPLAPGERIETFDLGDPTLAERMLARMTWEARAAAA